MAAQGWIRDPSKRHDERWFSGGQPTALVRDGLVEARDEWKESDIATDAPEPAAEQIIAKVRADKPRTFITAAEFAAYEAVLPGLADRAMTVFEAGARSSVRLSNAIVLAVCCASVIFSVVGAAGWTFLFTRLISRHEDSLASQFFVGSFGALMVAFLAFLVVARDRDR